MGDEEVVADALNAIRASNLSGAAGRDEYFTMAADDFGSETESDDSDHADNEDEVPFSSVTTDPREEVQRLSEIVVTDDTDTELEKTRNFKLLNVTNYHCL